jgi:membrane protease YdiL (CAAX protease family)
MAAPSSPVRPRGERFGQHPAVIVLSLVLVLLPVPLAMFLAQWTGSDPVALAGTPISLLLAWAALRARGDRWADVGLARGPAHVRVLVVALVATALLLPLTHVLLALLATAGSRPDLSKFDILRGNVAYLVVILLIVWTSAAFGEELLCRGFLMHSLYGLLRRRTAAGPAWAVALLLTTVLFGAGHAYQGAAGMIGTGVVGLGCGLAFFAARRNLWAAILVHGLYDTVGFVVLFLSLNHQLGPTGSASVLGA